MRKLAYLLICGLVCSGTNALRAQSTIFNYQGRLNVNGNQPNGLYDFVFTIYKVETNGLIIAGPLTNSAVPVSNGLFNVALDFGKQPFLGVNRFLDIAVRTNDSTLAFTSLAPRIRIASAPYAIAAANVIDGAVTAEALSPGPGPEGQVLKMSNGVLTWAPDLNSGGGVASVGSGTGLLGGPITNSGTLSIDPALVPLLNVSNRYVGSFLGDGSRLTNINTTATNVNINLNGDVTGPSSASIVARIRSVNVATTAPTNSQHLRFNGTNWTPASVALATDVSGTLADARLSANVPLLNANQTFAGSNTFNGVASMTNVNNKFVGGFFGNGAGLSNIVVSSTNTSVTMGGDVTGPSAASTVARIRSVNVVATAPTAGQHLRFSGTDWTPAAVALATDVSGTLADARLSGNVSLLNGNQTFTGSNIFNGVSIFLNANNSFTGNGANLTALNAANIGSGTLADARLSANVPLLNGSNIFSGVASITNVNNKLVGTFFGNGAGLSNIVVSSTNTSVTMSGDVTGPSSASTVARIRSVNVLATAPVAGQHLRFSGTDWTPASVALGTDVSGSLGIGNGGTGGSTAAGARANLGAAASGANTDITSINGLTSPLSAIQGGSGQGTYAAGDMLYAPVNNVLTRRSIGTPGQVLTVSNGLPMWAAASNHTHFGQFWTGSAGNGLFVENTSTNDGSSAVVGSAPASSGVTFGLFGQSASPDGTGVQGLAYGNTNGNSTGVYGQSISTNGTGVVGVGSAQAGVPVGVYGEADAPLGIGVYGLGAATSGVPVGVYGTVSGTVGYGFYTPNNLYVGGGGLMGALLVSGVTICTNAGNKFAGSFAGDGSGLTNISATATNVSVTLSGDVTGPSGSTTVGRIRGVNVLATSPTVGQVLRFSGTDWTPSLVALGTDVSGTLADARLSSNIPLLNASQTFAGTNSFTRVLVASGSSNAPAISFTNSRAAGLWNPGTNIVGLATSGSNRVYIAADGKVGIGRTPTANTLEVEGTASKTASGQWLANSDARIKTEVKNLDHALETIERVRPVSFNYTDEYRAAHPSIEDKRYYNVIAQEFAKVFPDSVKESGEMLDGKPILQVDVHPAAIYAIAAIQELHGLLKAKEDDLTKLKEQNASLEKRLQTLEKVVNGLAR